LAFDLSPLFFSQISSIKCVISKEVTTEMSLAASASVLSGDFSPPSGQFEVTCVVGGVSGFTFDFWPLAFDR